MCLRVLECVGVCTVCVCEFMFMRRRVEALEGRTHTQLQRCGGGVELIAGCCSWARQSPESLLTPGPKEPEERERGGGGGGGSSIGREGERCIKARERKR